MAQRHGWKYCKYGALLMISIVVLNQLLLLFKHQEIFSLANTDDLIAASHADQRRYSDDTQINNVDDQDSDLSALDSMHANHQILSFSDGLSLTTEIVNAETNERITCNPQQYKYIQLLLRDLKHYNLRDAGHLITSKQIDASFEEHDVVRWFWLRRSRMQIIDGQLYTNNIQIGEHDEEGYRTGVILYLRRLFKLYGAHIPNTDFLWHYHDKKGSMTDLSEYDWKNLSKVPIFVSDFNEASLPNTRTLYFIPRGYLKYRYFADIAERQGGEGKSDLYCQKNIRRIKDYLEYLELEQHKPQLLEWQNKQINKAVFRGYLNNGFSRRHFFNTLNLPEFQAVAEQYFDAKFTTEWANTAKEHVPSEGQHSDRFHANKVNEFAALESNALNVEQQFAYRYQVNIDGYGVRDNLMYQMLSGSVILKQLSTLIEFWYYDLVDNEHVVFWENILDLINTVIKIVDSMEIKHRQQAGSLTGFNNWILKNWHYMVRNNMTRYNEQKLREITENAKQFVADFLGANNMDCFFIHMLEIYNYYFFDTDSLPSTPHSRLKPVT